MSKEVLIHKTIELYNGETETKESRYISKETEKQFKYEDKYGYNSILSKQILLKPKSRSQTITGDNPKISISIWSRESDKHRAERILIERIKSISHKLHVGAIKIKVLADRL